MSDESTTAGGIIDNEVRDLSQKKCSLSLATYARTSFGLLRFAVFVEELAELHDRADGLFDEIEKLVNGHGDLRSQKEAVAQQQLEENRPLFNQMLLSRSVDNFLTFLADLLFQVFKAKPQLLRSNEAEKLDFVLQFSDMEQLIDALVEKKVIELSHKSLTELQKYFDTRLGVELAQATEFEALSNLVEKRNLIVHRRGIMDKAFIRKTQGSDGDVGSSLTITNEHIKDSLVLLLRAASRLDRLVRAKFDIESTETPRIPELKRLRPSETSGNSTP
jgi:hypothetical protein